MESLVWLQAASLLENGISLISTALGLGLVIFFHELGHFAVAKWCDVYVERFSIGFGPVLLGWKWGETEYALSAIPFGGYVKMLGQDDSDPSQMTNEDIAADPRSYSAKPVWQRMAIISAGVTMNLITAILFFTIAFAAGVETAPPIIGEVRPGMPAWIAGLEPGDRIERINGRKIDAFVDISLNTALSDDTVRLEGVRRDGKTPFDLVVEPLTSKNRPDITRPQIGLTEAGSMTLDSDPKGTNRQVVPGMPAASAEPAFKPNDKIQSIDGHEVKNYAEFQRRLAARNVQGAIEIVVERKAETAADAPGEPVKITVGENHFRRLGLRMDCGPIAALQEGSPAAQAGLKVGDKLLQVNGLNVGTDLDPMKLPNECARWAGTEIVVKVNRKKEGSGTEEVTINLTPDDQPGWIDQPDLPGEPLTISSLGVAFHLIPKVLSVEPDSPAEAEGIKREARILKAVLFLEPNEPQDRGKEREYAVSLFDEKSQDKENNWAHVFWMIQNFPQRKVKLTLLEDQKERVVTLTPVVDPDWPLPLLGIQFAPLRETIRANGIGEAFSMGLNHTRTSVLSIYLTLRSLLVTQRLSVKELHGPIGIAEAAFFIASQGIVPLLLFLGFLSVNLAVLNFLPIPVLDGGHMVFLLWEGITRRKPSEQVQAGATYVGMIFLLSLMALVLYLDLFVHKLGLGR
ncbi:MAG: site-2 protease family protein [Planctomycetaceae bacterium]